MQRGPWRPAVPLLPAQVPGGRRATVKGPWTLGREGGWGGRPGLGGGGESSLRPDPEIPSPPAGCVQGSRHSQEGLVHRDGVGSGGAAGDRGDNVH